MQKRVNPYCSYVVKGKAVPGVAIILRELLKCLDDLGIPHAYESDIRRRLRKRDDCKTSANQHFLRLTSESSNIDRTRGDTRNMSCIIIPKRDVPEIFFNLLEGLYMCILFITKLTTLTGHEQNYTDSGSHIALKLLHMLVAVILLLMMPLKVYLVVAVVDVELLVAVSLKLCLVVAVVDMELLVVASLELCLVVAVMDIEHLFTVFLELCLVVVVSLKLRLVVAVIVINLFSVVCLKLRLVVAVIVIDLLLV